MEIKVTFLDTLKETKYQVLTKNLQLLDFKSFEECLIVPEFLCILEILYDRYHTSSKGSYYVEYKVNMFDRNKKQKSIDYKGIKCVKIDYSYCQAKTYYDMYGYYANLIDSFGNLTRYRITGHEERDLCELFAFMESLASNQKQEINWNSNG